jgi:hypothetical protein
MLAEDGTPNKSNLGANAILGTITVIYPYAYIYYTYLYTLHFLYTIYAYIPMFYTSIYYLNYLYMSNCPPLCATILGISLAVAKAGAAKRGVPLYQVRTITVTITVNVIPIPIYPYLYPHLYTYTPILIYIYITSLSNCLTVQLSLFLPSSLRPSPALRRPGRQQGTGHARALLQRH